MAKKTFLFVHRNALVTVLWLLMVSHHVQLWLRPWRGCHLLTVLQTQSYALLVFLTLGLNRNCT